MADLSIQCPDILKDGDTIDLTDSGKIMECGNCCHGGYRDVGNAELDQNEDENQDNQDGNGQQGNNNRDQGRQDGNGNNNQNNNPGGNNNQDLEELAQQVEDLGVNTEHLNNFVRYILRVYVVGLIEDIPTLWGLIISGLDLQQRAGFNESITLQDLQALFNALRALNDNQQGINTVSDYLSQQNFADLNENWAVTLQQATDFITMLANNPQFDNLEISVLFGHLNNNRQHLPDEGHFFGLGNGENFERIGPQRVFVHYGNDNEGVMFFLSMTVYGLFKDKSRMDYHTVK